MHAISLLRTPGERAASRIVFHFTSFIVEVTKRPKMEFKLQIR